MHLLLLGLPRSGKTSVGAPLAAALGRPFIDLDRSLEEAYALRCGGRRDCRVIYRTEGEAAFRALEREQLALLPARPASVVALGGGAILAMAPEQLRALGLLIHLTRPLPLLAERLAEYPAYLDSSLPLADAFHALAAERFPLYEAAAHLSVELGALPPQASAMEVWLACQRHRWLSSDEVSYAQ